MAPSNPYNKRRIPLSPLKGSLTNQANQNRPIKKKRQNANEQAVSSNVFCADEDDTNKTDNETMMDLVSILVFNVYASGFCCRVCDIQVGGHIESIRWHLRKFHANLQCTNVSSLHSRLEATKKSLVGSRPSLPVTSASETRLKCLSCGRSYSRTSKFYRHKHLSNGNCNTGQPIWTSYVKMACGRLFEMTPSITPQSTSTVLVATPTSFVLIESTLAKYIWHDEDVGTFISLFTPLIQSTQSFDSIVSDTIDSYNMPPAQHELQLRYILEMAEKWLLQRARHKVSIIPGNYCSALLQFDCQDMGEVSQNLTYNFRHQELTLLPELKRILSLLWRSRHPWIPQFQQSMDVNDPHFVARLLSTFFHEATMLVYTHPILIWYTLCRFFRKSLDGSLRMNSAGQNASLAAAVLSLLRSGVCSLICSAHRDMDQLAYDRAVRQSQLCRTANILAPMIWRLWEMERCKKKTRMVTVDPTGMIAVDGFEMEKDQWSSLIPSLLTCCESLLVDLLVGDDWRLIVNLRNHVAVARDFSFSKILPDGSQSIVATQGRLRHCYTWSVMLLHRAVISWTCSW